MIVANAGDIYLGLMQTGVFYTTCKDEEKAKRGLEDCTYITKLSDNTIGIALMQAESIGEIFVADFDEPSLEAEGGVISKTLTIYQLTFLSEEDEFKDERKRDYNRLEELICRLINEGLEIDNHLLRSYRTTRTSEYKKVLERGITPYIFSSDKPISEVIDNAYGLSDICYNGSFIFVYLQKEKDHFLLYKSTLEDNGRGWYNLNLDNLMVFDTSKTYVDNKYNTLFQHADYVGQILDDIDKISRHNNNLEYDYTKDPRVEDILTRFNFGTYSIEKFKQERYFVTSEDFLRRHKVTAKQLNHIGSRHLYHYVPGEIYVLYSNYRDIYYCFTVYKSFLFMFPARIIGPCEQGKIIACRDYLEFWKLNRFYLNLSDETDSVCDELTNLYDVLKAAAEHRCSSSLSRYELKVDFNFEKDRNRPWAHHIQIWDKLQSIGAVVSNRYGCFGDENFDISTLKPVFNISYEESQCNIMPLKLPVPTNTYNTVNTPPKIAGFSASPTQTYEDTASYLVISKRKDATPSSLFNQQDEDAFYVKRCDTLEEIRAFKEFALSLRCYIFKVELCSLDSLEKVTPLENYKIKKSLSVYDYKVSKKDVKSVLPLDQEGYYGRCKGF